MCNHRPTALATVLAAALTAGFSTAALAQSAYTMTLLDKPTGAYSFVPTTLDDRSSSLIWANNSVTPLVSPNNDGVQAIAMTDQGTVVGCILSASGVQGVDARPFIWKNGVLLDLTQEWASKGVSLPAGTRWCCPLAINNGGSVLLYSYSSTSPDTTITWARINAKP